ncbi:MAG: arsenite methyltransferase [Chitinivibrionia bacterium]|nr:arsenite methyltransferase [Chitinivibrionia bacterium]
MGKIKGKDARRENVRTHYEKVAQKGTLRIEDEECSPSCCDNSPPIDVRETARLLGYSEEDLQALPENLILGLGCGNPIAVALLKKGETVLDLGSGTGFDCFLAADRVEAKGRVIGVDMTAEMLLKARSAIGKRKNVEFRLGEIEHLPVADNAVDVIMSNCVINLSPDKQQVFNEAYRVLRPGGRLAISDVIKLRSFTGTRWAGDEHMWQCISGSITVKELTSLLKKSGFRDVKIVINEASGEFIKDWDPGSGVENYIRSAIIEARK